MPRRRRVDLSGPTGRYLKSEGGGTTGQGRTEKITKYMSKNRKKAYDRRKR